MTTFVLKCHWMAAVTSPKIPPSKSDFIRSQHESLSAADIVAKAKDAGLKLSAQLVYNVRGKANAKPAKMKASNVTKQSKAAMSKADFIRSTPTSASAKEVVAKGKAAGIALSDNHVHAVRAADKTRSNKKRANGKANNAVVARAPIPAATTAAKNGARASAVEDAERAFIASVAQIGIVRATEILDGARARVHAVIGATNG
jgi:hypothetical protein